MGLKAFLWITAIGEGVTGLALLLLPAVPLALLLGARPAAPETLLVARIAGAALIGIGMTSGAATNADRGGALRAVLAGVLLYDVLVAVVLVDAAVRLGFVGGLLVSAVVAHGALAIWCGMCLRSANSAPSGSGHG